MRRTCNSSGTGIIFQIIAGHLNSRVLSLIFGIIVILILLNRVCILAGGAGYCSLYNGFCSHRKQDK